MMWIVFMVVFLLLTIWYLVGYLIESRYFIVRFSPRRGKLVENKQICLDGALVFFVLFLTSGIFYWWS